jgi:hypothetical protein
MKINFDLIYKSVILVLLIMILFFSISNTDRNTSNNELNEIGRYKEIKVKKSGFGGDREEVLILDTKTGETTNP